MEYLSHSMYYVDLFVYLVTKLINFSDKEVEEEDLQ